MGSKRGGEKAAGKEKEEEVAMQEMMAETRSKKKIDSKMFKNILSMKQEELSTAAAEYQEMRERAARWRFIYFLKIKTLENYWQFYQGGGGGLSGSPEQQSGGSHQEEGEVGGRPRPGPV